MQWTKTEQSDVEEFETRHGTKFIGLITVTIFALEPIYSFDD